MTSFSIVIPTYNGRSVLGDQLESLAQTKKSGDFEVLLADNGSTDGTLDLASAFLGRLPMRVVDASLRRGPGAARNIGAREARGDVLLFLDDDDAVAPTWLENMTAAFADQRADIVAGAISFDFKNRAEQGKMLVNSLSFLPYGVTANLGIRKSVFEKLEGFDETFRADEDVEFCWRAQLAGYRLVFADSAVVYKRSKLGARSACRQHFSYGRAEAKLFHRYRLYGMPRGTTASVKRWAWTLVHVPAAGIGRQRHQWVRVLGHQTGRIRGAIENRIFFL